MTAHILASIIFAYVMGAVSLFHFYRTKYVYTHSSRWYYLGDAIVAAINLGLVMAYTFAPQIYPALLK